MKFCTFSVTLLFLLTTNERSSRITVKEKLVLQLEEDCSPLPVSFISRHTNCTDLILPKNKHRHNKLPLNVGASSILCQPDFPPLPPPRDLCCHDEGKVHLRTGHEGPGGSRIIALFFL